METRAAVAHEAGTQCPWGEKAFSGYLGGDRAAWAEHDAAALIRSGARCAPILVDQGEAGQFLEAQLHPHLLEEASTETGQPLELRRHPGYDHSYYFIHTFIADHLEHHAQGLADRGRRRPDKATSMDPIEALRIPVSSRRAVELLRRP